MVRGYQLFQPAGLLLVLLFLALITSCGSKVEQQAQPEPDSQTDEQEELYQQYNIERGKRLVELGGCSQCQK